VVAARKRTFINEKYDISSGGNNSSIDKFSSTTGEIIGIDSSHRADSAGNLSGDGGVEAVDIVCRVQSRLPPASPYTSGEQPREHVEARRTNGAGSSIQGDSVWYAQRQGRNKIVRGTKKGRVNPSTDLMSKMTIRECDGSIKRQDTSKLSLEHTDSSIGSSVGVEIPSGEVFWPRGSVPGGKKKIKKKTDIKVSRRYLQYYNIASIIGAYSMRNHH
jgi:hypothetical protein